LSTNIQILFLISKYNCKYFLLFRQIDFKMKRSSSRSYDQDPEVNRILIGGNKLVFVLIFQLILIHL
jgi:hypothetical protein